MRRPRLREAAPLVTWRLRREESLRLRREAITQLGWDYIRYACVSGVLLLLAWWLLDRIGFGFPARLWLFLIGLYCGTWVIGLIGLAWLSTRRSSFRYELDRRGIRVGDNFVRWSAFEGYAVDASLPGVPPALVLRRRNGFVLRRPLPLPPRQDKVIGAIAAQLPPLPENTPLRMEPVPVYSRVLLASVWTCYLLIGLPVLWWLRERYQWTFEDALPGTVSALVLGPGTLWLTAGGKAWRRRFPRAVSFGVAANFALWIMLLLAIVAMEIIDLRRQGHWPPLDAAHFNHVAQ